MVTINLRNIIQEQHKNISGIAVLKDSHLIYEDYFNGFNHCDSVHIASVTKSIMSALIGIAIDQGFIKSVQQNVLDFFPDYPIKRGEKRLQKVTIYDLLTMTAPYKYKYEPYTKVYSSGDWVKSVLDLLGGKGEIGEFKYTTVGLQVLSGVLTNATNQRIFDFAKENLFEPLDIKVTQDIRIHDKEEHFSFLKNNKVSGWVVDPKGINTAGWGLTLTTKDMANFGQLYLSEGSWGNKQVISSEWIRNSTKKHSLCGGREYGYLWWVIHKNNAYAAIGDSGNIIYISPDKNLVVVIASQFMPRAKDRLELIHQHIEPLL